MLENLLPAIWFGLWGLLWAIYFSLDGFDLGAGMLAAVVRERQERLLLIETLGPVWDGNEVWLITAGGVTFAAFPRLYATMFSSLYAPLMLVLVGLILRAVAIEFIHLHHTPRWQSTWAWVLACSSGAVALLFGVAFGNMFQGLLLDAAGYHGTILSLLNPYGLLTGALFVVAFLYNGSTWLAHKASDDNLRRKGIRYATVLWPVLAGGAALFVLCTPGFTTLLGNYVTVPWLFLLPLAGVATLALSRLFLHRTRPGAALVTGSATVLLAVGAAIAGMYPNMFPSRLDAAQSLTALNSASSPATLKLMLIVTLIFLPLVLVYQVWFYHLFGRPETRHGSGY